MAKQLGAVSVWVGAAPTRIAGKEVCGVGGSDAGRARMVSLFSTAGLASLAVMSSVAALAQDARPTLPPEPLDFAAQAAPRLVGRDDIQSFRALPIYHEPLWVTEDYVEAGLLPPVAERLPREPLVFSAAAMPDGIGVYGDVLRHVTGGRPEGWNFWAGQTLGWGGIEVGSIECLTRTGPLFMVRSEDLEPLPNLARSWEWSEDGRALTMHLVEGARWSDGDPFDAQDVLFAWEDVILDPELTPTYGTTPDVFGKGTTLAALDSFTIRWTFTTPFRTDALFAMANGLCPAPSHLLKPLHPRYGPEATYDSFRNAFPPEFLGFPTLGPWVVTAYRPDEVIVTRRNPYYWKVDEAGNQLPYLDEVQYRLSTWEGRDIQTAAGLGDFASVDHPEFFVEVLRRAADPASPARLEFGPRTWAFSILFNFSGNGWGEPDLRAQAIRELNRNLDFRIAVTSALDRELIGQSLVKGPFTTPYPGGLMHDSPYFDAAATAFYPYDPETARFHMARAGLVDRDGDGFVNFPEDVMNGGNVEVTLLSTNSDQTSVNLAEAVVAFMAEVGLRVVPHFLDPNNADAFERTGRWDWVLRDTHSELLTVVQSTTELAPLGPETFSAHRAGPDGTLDLLPFEQELVRIAEAFIATGDPEERRRLMRDYQRVSTTNVTAAGLIQFAAPLLVNKRFANVPPGTPGWLYSFGEDAVMRERLYVPPDWQTDYELLPRILPPPPGVPG